MASIDDSGPLSVVGKCEAMPVEEHCERCGNFGEGDWRWMFHQGPPTREFYCVRCLKILRIYAVIGFTLLGLLVTALAGAILWIRFLS